MFTSTRVPQGVLNATSYFQGMITDLLQGLDCKVWVKDVFYLADSEEALLTLLNEILGRVTKSRLYVECISDDMDDDLGICSEDMDDDMDAGVIS